MGGASGNGAESGATWDSPSGVVCSTMGAAPLGAQTGRQGGAGPAGGLLGGKDPTGRFFCFQPYQSEPSTSLSDGVTAAHQVFPLILGDSVRTLPSARQTGIPPA